MERSGSDTIDASYADVLAVYAALQGFGVEFSADHPPVLRERVSGPTGEVLTAEDDVGKRILVADDDAMSRDLLNRRLTRLGFRITTAETGYDALSILAQSRFGAVLLDGMMPDLPGLEVLQRLRNAKNYTRVIMVTGKALASDIDEAMALGADGYITKPIDFKKLIELIDDKSKRGD